MGVDINVNAGRSTRQLYAKLDQLAQTDAGRDTKLKLKSSMFRGLHLKGKRWSRKFGPVVKVDRMMKVTVRNEETQEPFARV